MPDLDGSHAHNRLDPGRFLLVMRLRNDRRWGDKSREVSERLRFVRGGCGDLIATPGMTNCFAGCALRNGEDGLAARTGYPWRRGLLPREEKV